MEADLTPTPELTIALPDEDITERASAAAISQPTTQVGAGLPSDITSALARLGTFGNFGFDPSSSDPSSDGLGLGSSFQRLDR